MSDRQLYIEIIVDDAGAMKNVGGAAKSASVSMGALESAMTRANAVGGALARIGTDLVYAIGRGVVGAFTSAIELSNKFNNAFIGLGSGANAFGVSADDAKAAAVRLSNDGL